MKLKMTNSDFTSVIECYSTCICMYTAVSTKVVPQKCRIVCNADWHYE